MSCDSEVVLACLKRVTSRYLSDNNADVCDVVDAEIQRLTEQTAKLERQLTLTHLGRGDDSTGVQLASGSRISSRDTSPDAAVLRKRLEYVTVQRGHRHGQPSTEHLDMLSSGRHSVVQAKRSPSPKIRRHTARRHDIDRDSLIAGRRVAWEAWPQFTRPFLMLIHCCHPVKPCRGS